MNKTTTAVRGPINFLLLAATLLAGSVAHAAELEVIDPWVALSPPGAHATAAFMELRNAGEQPVDLVAASVDGFQVVELHRSIEENGMHRMVQQERITVPAGGSVELAPGGYHVMLIGAESELEEGEVLTLELTLGDGSRVSVEAPVKRREQAMGGHGHSHDNGGGHEH
ncbi:copper chaperone PCu(A)C [Guyparkeria hydrothermalis]|uniref:copper chaperone PCu(A)C n=1 Tax=Guyparkeria hydrothermalis TaxID=923 RepID=UPI00201FC706|nr:copper chaperone PCu(A)C [Guyparkeria hydrothermalis]MCL7744498.1 copper chaperone PCu(A)C [Guyparkeria hydrothermalis]